MRRTISLSILAVLVLTAACLGQLKSNDLVAICGDSITEQKLYSLFMEEYLTMCLPSPVKVVQFGWSGETSWGFLARMENDVLTFRPTVATTCYGMNDGGYTAPDPARQQQYRQATESIVKTFKTRAVKTIVVGSPGAVDLTTFRRADPNVYNQTLAQLRDIAKAVADQEGVLFADVHWTMRNAMAKAKAKYGFDYPVAGRDGFHPGPNGHLVMAYAFLKALGCDGHIGTITLDMRTGKAKATSGHRIIKSDKRAITVESRRYPFCFFGEPNNPNSTSGIIECIDFNQDLNRLMLVIENCPQTGVRITWGKETKAFPASRCQEGINLAAEFLDNPFREPFKKVEELLKKKQAFETVAVKQLLHSLPQWSSNLPEAKAALEQLKEHIIKKDQALRNAALSEMRPVRHTIYIEPEIQ
ncbi:MAG: SGNH/GDSL hydrolase family protein [Sedimentisphaerales bacterium]|nr:SGNH/GDSL hydrolase family protein [Sedimentisphaerales bacterium]